VKDEQMELSVCMELKGVVEIGELKFVRATVNSIRMEKTCRQQPGNNQHSNIFKIKIFFASV